MNLQHACEVAVEAVHAGASAVLGAGAGGNLGVRTKARGDYVCRADKEAEDAILGILCSAFPHCAFTSEEGLDSGGSPWRWVVDPLDGTANFVHGIPYFAVTVALLHEGRPVVGVVHDPNRDETFHAVTGQGAWCGGERLSASSCTGLAEAMMGTVVPVGGHPGMRDYLGRFNAVALGAAGMRRAGACALDLAYVAGGRLDGFWVESLKAWDMAGGCLLVSEAGGVASDLGGAPYDLSSTSLVAAGAGLHAELMETLVPGISSRG